MAREQNENRIMLFPLTAEASEKGRLFIGGCDTVALAEEFGTPLYVFDEATLRQKCVEFRDEFGRRYPGSIGPDTVQRSFDARKSIEEKMVKGLRIDNALLNEVNERYFAE